jgi:hypothetical protein
MFYDVKKTNYEALKKRTQTIKPYRGSDAFPLGFREYSDRHFRPLKDEEGFALYYADRQVIDQTIKLGHLDNSRYWRTPFAIVRADNSIEFVRKTGHMNENLILQQMLHGHVFHSKTHGGTLIKRIVGDTDGKNDEFKYITHPVFKGLRIDMDTLRAVTPYELYSKKLIREEAREYLKQFEDTKKAGMTMLRAMKPDGINELIQDVRSACYSNYNKAFFEAVNNNHYLDALSCFYLHESGYWWEVTEERKDRFMRLMDDMLSKKFNDYVLKNSNIGFQLVKLESEKLFSSCKWGYSIVCNGKEVVRI